MSMKTLSTKLARVRGRVERQYGTPEPPCIVCYFGIGSSTQAEMYAALSQELDQGEQAQFSTLWQQIAPKITYASNGNFDRYSLHALSDPELDELERWLLLLRERGAGLAGCFDADRSAHKTRPINAKFGAEALEDN